MPFLFSAPRASPSTASSRRRRCSGRSHLCTKAVLTLFCGVFIILSTIALRRRRSLPSLHCLATDEVPGPPPHYPLAFPERFNTRGALPDPTCEAFLGNTWLRRFIDSRREVCSPGTDQHGVRSRITRWDAPTGGRFYWFRNVAVDFSRMVLDSEGRALGVGFLTAACNRTGPLDFIGERADAAYSVFELDDGPGSSLSCDAWVDEPTLVVHHDGEYFTYPSQSRMLQLHMHLLSRRGLYFAGLASSCPLAVSPSTAPVVDRRPCDFPALRRFRIQATASAHLRSTHPTLHLRFPCLLPPSLLFPSLQTSAMPTTPPLTSGARGCR